MSAIQPFYEMMPYEHFVLSDDEDGSDDGSKESCGSASKRMYWQDTDWVPTTAKGTKQKTPQQIRTDLEKHMSASDTLETLLTQLQRESNDVTEESLRLFWDLKKHYKGGAFEATSNPVYLAAARLLERVKYERTHQRQQPRQQPKKEVSVVRPSSKLIRGRKRKSPSSTSPSTGTDGATFELEEGSSPTTVTNVAKASPAPLKVMKKKRKQTANVQVSGAALVRT